MLFAIRGECRGRGAGLLDGGPRYPVARAQRLTEGDILRFTRHSGRGASRNVALPGARERCAVSTTARREHLQWVRWWPRLWEFEELPFVGLPHQNRAKRTSNFRGLGFDELRLAKSIPGQG